MKSPKLTKKTKVVPEQAQVETETDKIAINQEEKIGDTVHFESFDEADPKNLKDLQTSVTDTDKSHNENCISKENESLIEDVRKNELREVSTNTTQTSVLSKELIAEAVVDQESKKNIDNEGDKIEGLKNVGGGIKEMEESNEDAEERSDHIKSSSLTNIKRMVSEAPSLFFISKKYGLNDVQYKTGSNKYVNLVRENKRKMEDVESAMAFEDSLYVSK